MTHPIAVGCSARVIAEPDPPVSRAFVGRLVEVKTIATKHPSKPFVGKGAYVWAPGFGWWFPLAALEWISDDAPVWPPRYDEDDGCEDCEELSAEIATLTAENARLAKLNGRRERQIARARLQEEGTPVTPEWLGDVEMIWPEAVVTMRLASALRRAWAERDRAQAIVATAPHGDACHLGCVRDQTILGCDCWKSQSLTPTEAR